MSHNDWFLGNGGSSNIKLLQYLWFIDMDRTLNRVHLHSFFSGLCFCNDKLLLIRRLSKTSIKNFYLLPLGDFSDYLTSFLQSYGFGYFTNDVQPIYCNVKFWQGNQIPKKEPGNQNEWYILKATESYRKLPKATKSYPKIPKASESYRKLPKATESYLKLLKAT